MNIEKFLEQNVKPATGCTEPIAVSYATSLAYNALHNNLPMKFNQEVPKPKIKNIKKISVQTDRNVFKNAASIAIPGTGGQKGIPIATAIGIFCNPAKELNLLEDSNNEILEKANKLLQQNKIQLKTPNQEQTKTELDIKIKLKYQKTNETKTAYTRLRHRHNHIEKIKVDNKIKYEGEYNKNQQEKIELPKTIKELIEISKNLTKEQKETIYQGIKMNREIAKEGLKTDHGAGIGTKLKDLKEQKILSDSLENEIKIKTAAASDARMGGARKPVMTSAGSGNQGITAIIPIQVVAQRKNKNKDKLCEAVMLSHLITKYITERSGHLSALCGCAVKAGIGATAGITYLLGGEHKEINNAINLTAANITGIICDGAKEGCSLKLSTSSTTALESAYMALQGTKVPIDNGIIHKKAEKTIESIAKISEGMIPTDHSVVDIIQQKQKKKN